MDLPQFILLSPCLFLAQDYMLLPRLARWLDAEASLFLRPSRIVKIFVWSDVLTFLLQAGGGGLTATDKETSRNLGRWVSIRPSRVGGPQTHAALLRSLSSGSACNVSRLVSSLCSGPPLAGEGEVARGRADSLPEISADNVPPQPSQKSESLGGCGLCADQASQHLEGAVLDDRPDVRWHLGAVHLPRSRICRRVGREALGSSASRADVVCIAGTTAT